MAAVSIIVPVYRVEKYIHRCIESLINQTLKDIEIILIDDGSPDNCPEICDDFAKRDNRIKVIHKENGGLSSARNAGLSVAVGKYVGFVDSDDDIEPDMYKKMFQCAEKYNTDFVMSDYTRILSNNTNYIVTKLLRAGLFEKKDIKEEIYPVLIMTENVDYGPLLSVCNCLYNRAFLQKNEITFADDVKWSEDNLFSSYVGYNAQRIYYMKGEALYHYHQNADSITTSYRSGAWSVYCRMNEYLHHYFDSKTDFDFSRQLKLHILYYACNVINMESMNASNIYDASKRIKCILNTSEFTKSMEKFKLPLVSIKLKIQLFMMKHKMALLLAFLLRR